MKIVCGACGAKYSIADEKVQGKVFKIRCKKCSNVIVVKGNEDGTGDETINETVGAAEWYVVVDGEQVGPISTVDMDSYYMSGRINAESFAWRDGLADWVPLRTLDDFQHLTQQDAAGPEEKTQISDNFSMYQAQANAAEDADSTNIMSTSNSFGSYGEEPSDAGNFDSGYGAFGGGDLGFGHAPSSFESASSFSSFDAPSEPDSGGGMFASFDSPKAAVSSKSSANDDFLGFTASDPSPMSSSPSLSGGAGAAAVLGGDMVGKRNENSVLFSLSSLDQVQAVSSKGPSSSGPADVPVTDGSGLIDIRALASAHKTMKSGGDDHSASVDPFTTGTMAMPALMPMGSHRSNKPIIIGGVVAAVIFLVMGSGLIYILATRDTNAQPQIIKEQVIVREVIKEQGDDGKAAQEAAEAEKAALAAVANEEPTTDNAGATEKTSTTKRSTTSKSTASTAPKEESKPAEETKVVASSKKKEDNIDNLLAQLDSKEESKPATKTKTATKTASSGGKTELTRDDVQNVIRANSGRISTCHKSQNSGKLSGTLRVKFLIKPNGSVSNAEILTGTFAGTDVGSCVQKAVSGMKFPATSASTDFPVTYPFKLE